jgi:hypothetical protein
MQQAARIVAQIEHQPLHLALLDQLVQVLDEDAAVCSWNCTTRT